MTTIRALIEAGKKATQGEWQNGACRDGERAPIKHCIVATRQKHDEADNDSGDEEFILCEMEGYETQDSYNSDFIALAAASRPALETMLEEHERYRKALEQIAQPALGGKTQQSIARQALNTKESQ